jgi:hypothetical protein
MKNLSICIYRRNDETNGIGLVDGEVEAFGRKTAKNRRRLDSRV